MKHGLDVDTVMAIYRVAIFPKKKRGRSTECGKCSGLDHGEHESHAYRAANPCEVGKRLEALLKKYLEEKTVDPQSLVHP